MLRKECQTLCQQESVGIYQVGVLPEKPTALNIRAFPQFVTEER